MYILKNQNGEIIATCGVKPNEDWEEVSEEYGIGFDGKIYSKTEMLTSGYTDMETARLAERQKDDIRVQRSEECFPIINRGALWYDKLADEQKEELSSWYEEWLNAPETGIIPSKPTWIDSVTFSAVKPLSSDMGI